MGETVEEADDDKDEGVGNHHGLIPDTVDNPPYQRSKQETGDGRDGKQQADDSGIGSIEKDEHVGTEGEECKRYIQLSPACASFLAAAVENQNLSGRGENSILKLSRTIADMAGREEISIEHINEAVDFRKNEGGLDICF